MVSPENIHASNIIQTEQVTFKDMYVYTHTHQQSIEKEFMNSKESKDEYIGGVKGEKEGRMIQL